MPTYSYRCTECDNAFDIHQAFTDDTLTVCEVCGGKLRKLFNTIGVTFNGSGFYRTDSRNGGSGSSGSGSGSGSSSSSSSSSSGSSGSSSSNSSGGSSASGSSSTSSGGGSSSK
jgi:putative FmdB family regulatory protein